MLQCYVFVNPYIYVFDFFLILTEKNFMLIEIYMGGSEFFLKICWNPTYLMYCVLTRQHVLHFKIIFKRYAHNLQLIYWNKSTIAKTC